MRESSRALAPWREAIRHETQDMLEAGRGHRHWNVVEVSVTLTLPRPVSHWRQRGGVYVNELKPSAPLWPGGKPDVDKLLRAVLDAITAGGALADDSLVITGSATKLYGGFSEPAGCDVWIDQLRAPAKFTVSDPARDAIAAARASGAISGGLQ